MLIIRHICPYSNVEIKLQTSVFSKLQAHMLLTFLMCCRLSVTGNSPVDATHLYN
jgi:hypothetical protein